MASFEDIKKAKEEAKLLNEELAFLEDTLTAIGTKISNNITAQLKNVDTETAQIVKKFQSNLSSAIDQNAKSLKNIKSLQNDISKGVNVEAKIQKELDNIASRKATIRRQQNILQANGIDLSKEDMMLLEGQFAVQGDILKTLTDENIERQKQKSLLTLLGEGGADLLNQLDKSGTAAKLFKLNLKDTVTPMRLLEVAIGFVVEAFLSLDATTEKVAQNLGISFHEAAGLNQQFSQIAQDSNNIFVTTEGIANSQIQLSKAFGTNAMFTAEMLQTQTELTHQLKLSEETSASIAKLGILTGKTSKEIAANVLGQSVAMNAANGTAFTEKAILEEIANLSSSIQLSLANNPIELAKAVQTAKQFGMELSSVDGIANSLLDFESSIANELEAELLLGKNINLEKARQAALDNDLATVAEEVAKQAGSAAEFTAMNRLQQEALAKAVGMSREDLAKSLQSREVLAKLGGKDADMQAAYNRLKKEGLSQEQIAVKLGDEQLAQSLHSENIQSQFTASVGKMKELFVQVAAALIPIVEPIAALVGFMANLISQSMGFLKVLGSIFAISKTMSVLRKMNVGLAQSELALKEKDLFFSNALAAAETRKNIAKELGMGIGAQTLAIMGLQTAALEYQTARESGKNVIQALGLAIATQILGVKTMQSIQDQLQLVREGKKNVLSAIGVVLAQTKLGAVVATGLATVKNIAKLGIELAINTAIAAAKLVGVSASTLGIGTVVALAAAAAGIAYLNSVAKGDDILSPGKGKSGYGDRVLFGPEGAISLNNRDTVIAGTSLFKGNDVVSSPAGSIQMPDNSEAKKTNALLEALINKPAPKVQMDSIEVGTVAGMSAFSIQ